MHVYGQRLAVTLCELMAMSGAALAGRIDRQPCLLLRYDGMCQVVVEVGQVDPEAREGWVVLGRGTAHHVVTMPVTMALAGAGFGQPSRLGRYGAAERAQGAQIGNVR